MNNTKSEGVAAHTPGPWRCFQHATYPHNHRVTADISCVDGPVKIAECFHSASYSADANARLIAAAPDLLEACKVALEMLNDQVFIWGTDDTKRVAYLTELLVTATQKAGTK